MPRSNDDNSMAREGNSSLRVRQIQQENYYKTALINETAFQARLTKLNKSAEMRRYQDRLERIAQERNQVLKNQNLTAAKRDAQLKSLTNRRLAAEKRVEDLKLANERRAFEDSLKLTDNLYNQKNIRQRKQLQSELADVAKTQRARVEEQIAVAQAQLAITKNKIKQQEIQKQINKLAQESTTLAVTEASARNEVARFNDIIYQTSLKLADNEQEKLKVMQEELQARREIYAQQATSIKNEIETKQLELESTNDEDSKNELLSEIQALISELNNTRETFENSSEGLSNSITKQTVHSEAASKKKTLNDRIVAAKEGQTAQSRAENSENRRLEREAKKQERLAEGNITWKESLAEAFDPEKIGAKLSEKLNDALNQIDQNINSMFQYQAQINARLNGTDSDYSDILKTIRRNIGINPLVSQKAMVENVKKLVDSGVTFDLEQRAFLATISDKIVNTFDAFDSNLLRVIRLQQADSTAARLGMESALNEFLNSNFSDSSYLNDAFDSVAGSLIDASAKLSRDQSVAFEYIVQKWLGSLYSLGLSSNTVSTIAQGLSYLGTGNVEALSGNESLQSLLAMSAARAGLSYSDLLTGGIDANNTNLLLKSMVEYLKEIAENSGNNVTAASYANVFGMNTTDLVAINNLQQSQINSLYKSTLSIEEANSQLQSEMNQIFSRTHVSQLLETGLENLITTASTGIGSNLLTYGTWKIFNIIEDLTGGISIPTVGAFGNFLGMNATVMQLAKAGMAGLSLMGSLIGGIGSLLTGKTSGTMSWDTWKFDQYTSRGESINALKKGVKSGFSESSSMSSTGSAGGSDVKNSLLTDATSGADEDSKITNANVEKNADIYENIYKAIADESGPTTLTELVAIHSLLDEKRLFKAELGGFNDLKDLLAPNRVFYSALIGMLPVTGESLSFTNSGLQIKQTDSIKNYLSQNKTSSLVDIELNNLATKISQNQVNRISDLDSTIASYNATSKTSVATTTSTATTTSNPAQTLATAFRQALSAGSDDSESLMQLFKEIRDQLKDKVNVNVTNDYVDEVLQRLGTNI